MEGDCGLCYRALHKLWKGKASAATMSTEPLLLTTEKYQALEEDLLSSLWINLCYVALTQTILEIWKTFRSLAFKWIKVNQTCDKRFWATFEIQLPFHLPLLHSVTPVTCIRWCSRNSPGVKLEPLAPTHCCVAWDSHTTSLGPSEGIWMDWNMVRYLLFLEKSSLIQIIKGNSDLQTKRGWKPLDREVWQI